MEKDVVATLAGVLAGFFISLIFVIRYMLVNNRFPPWKKKKDK